ncbi:MAG: hypothetical protein QOH67_154 [Hyphomicrobiales bacterium]|jgi:hypothetical protein|nr:hypothetical protein [Hyphomicrobiales bacterium]
MKGITSRIVAVTAVGPSVLRVKWKNRPADRIDLSGWIETGGAVLARLRDPDVFGNPRVADYGASIAWGNDDDLCIDSVHLKQIAAGQSRSG